MSELHVLVAASLSAFGRWDEATTSLQINIIDMAGIKTLALSVLALALMGFGATGTLVYNSFTAPQPQTLRGEGGPAATTCIASSSIIAIGHQQSRGLLATSSRRAWAAIGQPVNASNTVALSLNDVTASLTGATFKLTPATSTSARPDMVFGLNTDFPYTGAIKALSDTASSTVLVTECVY